MLNKLVLCCTILWATSWKLPDFDGLKDCRQFDRGWYHRWSVVSGNIQVVHDAATWGEKLSRCRFADAWHYFGATLLATMIQYENEWSAVSRSSIQLLRSISLIASSKKSVGRRTLWRNISSWNINQITWFSGWVFSQWNGLPIKSAVKEERSRAAASSPW